LVKARPTSPSRNPESAIRPAVVLAVEPGSIEQRHAAILPLEPGARDQVGHVLIAGGILAEQREPIAAAALARAQQDSRRR
jgi:hypothetical protein